MTDMSSMPPAHQPSEGTGRGAGWGAVPPQPTPAPHTFTQPPVPGLPPTGRTPSRRKVWLTHGATALVALIFGTAIGGGGESSGTANASGASPAATVTETAAPKPAVTVTETVKTTVTAKPKPVKKSGPPSSFSGEGQFLVGEDIQAGTYRTSGPEDSVIPNCYWARLKNASGEFDAIIANDNIQGQGRVTVNKGEYFKTSGCQDWEKVG
ncbi:hypothetical protein [Streptomyces sp. NPDC005148]